MMQRILTILLAVAILGTSSGCVATRKFVRGEVNASSDALSARIDRDEGEIGELRDGVRLANDRVTQVNGRVTQIDSMTTEHGQRIDSLQGDVQTLDQKTVQARAAADQVAGRVITLDGKFESRNRFAVASTRSVLFRFDSAELDSKYHDDVDDIAAFLSANPNAIAVLEGRTDSVGDDGYNIRLGERRLEAVKRYMAVDKSVPVYRIHELSLGAARPVAGNDSREGREKNRAVTLTVLVPGTDSN